MRLAGLLLCIHDSDESDRAHTVMLSPLLHTAELVVFVHVGLLVWLLVIHVAVVRTERAIYRTHGVRLLRALLLPAHEPADHISNLPNTCVLRLLKRLALLRLHQQLLALLVFFIFGAFDGLNCGKDGWKHT